MTKVSTNIWFEKDAKEAVEFYVSMVPNSSIRRTTVVPADTPSGPEGSCKVIEFRLGDQEFTALEAGPLDPLNHSFSIVVACETQAEIDRLWDGFVQNGGVAEACGWLKDRFGLSWQVVPRVLGEMMADPDRAKARRMTKVMLQMVKLDIAKLEAAFRG
jgi:predicted 3-demethylubiquinone-9 3-methyltransferase (glyoxalase superfamily)